MSYYKEAVWMYYFNKIYRPWEPILYFYYMHPIARIRVCKRKARYGDSTREIEYTWQSRKNHLKNKAKRRRGK